MPYTYRTVKGLPLTHEEYDENFSYTEELFEATQDARDVAVSAGNFQGRWAEQAGSVAPPYAVSHNGRTWALNVELFDVTASEPTEANTDWTLLLGSVATKDHGTAAGEVPLNSDLPTFGSAAQFDVGPGATELPTNGYLGEASLKSVGLLEGELVEVILDDELNAALPALSGRLLTGLRQPVYEIFNATPAATYPPVYACRAWAYFDAPTMNIKAFGNVASITDNGSSTFTIQFTNPMPDVNYVIQSSTNGSENGNVSTGLTLTWDQGQYQFRMSTGAASGERAYRNGTVFAVIR